MKTPLFTAAGLLLAATVNAQIHLDVSLSARTLAVRDNANQTIAHYQISPGTAKHPTPTGNFTIRKIIWNPAWVPPDAKWAKGKQPTGPANPKNPMKVVKIFFKEPDLYIHGTADEAALGDPASHGCIRVDPNDAYNLARLLMQNGGASQSDAWYASVVDGSRTITVVLPKPVAMKIRR